MRKKYIIALLSVIMLFGVVPAYGTGASEDSLVWDSENEFSRFFGINVTTFTDNQSTTKSIYPKYVRDSQMAGEWIYFLVSDGTDEWFFQIAKIKKDGSAFTYISQDPDFSSIDVVGDTIYFLKRRKGDEDFQTPLSFGSMRTDGTKEKIVMSKPPFNDMGIDKFITINKGYIYYKNYDNDKLYRMKKDGTGAKVISSKGVSAYEFYGDVLFFSEVVEGRYNDSYIGVFVNPNGTRKTTFVSKEYTLDPVAYVDNKFYYTTFKAEDDVGNFKTDIHVYSRYTGKTNKLLSLDTNDQFLGKVEGGFAVLSFKKDTVYKVGFDGKVKK
ncbi:DUF5050 domain-containing protein [Paenibacillus sp. FSL R7-0313]|uniref:DUF5050 domain-containing protein n=1 Tax=Paenibacillus sp. FSL R7-0313 TaxID=2954532 RepID=UPI0030DB3836